MDDKANRQELYAHSKEGEPPCQWQPLEEHLENVAKLAASYAELFCSQDWAYNAGLLHDIGKADSSFQGYLRRANELDDSDYDSGRVNHSSAGAAFAEEKFGPVVGRVYAFIIAGHHAGLPDWSSAKTGHASLSARLPEGKGNLERVRNYAETAFSHLRTVSRPPSFIKPADFHLWVRMLYSCLVDADFLDTEEFINPQKTATRSEFESLTRLKDRFDICMSQIVAASKRTSVNAIRQEILAACIRAAQNEPGLFRLSVPTGGGKTLSSMAFAFEHSMLHNKNRIIYVIPYTSIIEQTAKIFSDIFGTDNVVEHHSNIDPENETFRSQLASENWDAPVIVTTNVQFFESLYAARSGRCRKLHNIINSVVILDEAQLLPPNLLKPCVDALNQLVNNYGVTLILATATQPALEGLGKAVEIIDPAMNLYERLKRTEIRFPEDLNSRSDWDIVASELIKHEQVLCIVNTRKDCHELFKLMPENTVYLSALMCGYHRSRIIRYIKWRLKKGRAIRVISTQLVEAGVDMDFPVVHRALTGLDSIAQAAGRCNREGKLNEEGRLGQVRVFVPPHSSPPGILRKSENATRELWMLNPEGIDSPATFTRFFELFYLLINSSGDQFRDLLIRDVPHCEFRTAASEFRLISDQPQRTIIVRYGRKCDELISSLRAVGPKRAIMRKLQRYTVNLSAGMAEKMKMEGLLEEISDGILVQTMPALYTKREGLDIFRETLPVEDLII